MASLDENVCHVKLGELLTTAHDDETRYGAFRALRTLNPRDPLVQGEQLNDSFWLHRVAPNTPPLVHISSTHRAEIATRVLEGRQRSASTAARSAGEVDFAQVDAILDSVRNAYDPEYGGFGPAPKFPQTDALALLL